MAQMRSNLGKYLAKVRIDHGLTLLDVATKLGVSTAFLSVVEVGTKYLSLPRAKQLASFLTELGVDVEEYKLLLIADRISRAFPTADDDLVMKMARLAHRNLDFFNTGDQTK